MHRSNVSVTTDVADELVKLRQLDLKTFLGAVNGEQAISRSFSLRAEQVTRVVAEVVGSPVPQGGYEGLMLQQAQIDVFLSTIGSCNRQSTSSMKTDRGAERRSRSPNNRPTQHSSRNNHSNNNNINNHNTSTTPTDGIIQDSNSLMHKQRVDQRASLLSALNELARRRKKLLQALLHLWQAVSVSQDQSRHYSSAGSIDHNEVITRTRELVRVSFQDNEELNTLQMKNVSVHQYRSLYLSISVYSCFLGNPTFLDFGFLLLLLLWLLLWLLVD